MIDKFFRLFCHGLNSRSLIVNGEYLPLCARCTGIYLCVAICLIYLVLTKKYRRMYISTMTAVILALLFLPFSLDGVGSYIGLWESNNIRRLASGAFCGIALPILYVYILNMFFIEKNDFFENRNKFSIINLVQIMLISTVMCVAVYNELVPYAVVTTVLALSILYNIITVIILAYIAIKRR